MKLRQDGYRKYNSVCDFIAFEELEYLRDEFLPTLEVKEVDLEQISKHYALNNSPKYCSNQTIIEGFKEAIKGE
jgi:hypothetical protein